MYMHDLREAPKLLCVAELIFDCALLALNYLHTNYFQNVF